MTIEKYNVSLNRFKKAMEWYHSKPSTEQQEKFLPAFEELLESLRVGCLELNIKNGGF